MFITSALSFIIIVAAAAAAPVFPWSGVPVVLCFHGPVLLTCRIGRFPSSSVCAAQDGCSHLKCLRHDSIMARGSAHLKHAVQRHSYPPWLLASLQYSRPSMHPTPVRPRATTPTTSLTLFISTTADGRAYLCRSRLRLRRSTATRGCSKDPAHPVHVARLACLPRAHLVPSLCSAHSVPG